MPLPCLPPSAPRWWWCYNKRRYLYCRRGCSCAAALADEAVSTATTGAAGAAMTTDAIALPSTVGTPLVMLLHQASLPLLSPAGVAVTSTASAIAVSKLSLLPMPAPLLLKLLLLPLLPLPLRLRLEVALLRLPSLHPLQLLLLLLSSRPLLAFHADVPMLSGTAAGLLLSQVLQPPAATPTAAATAAAAAVAVAGASAVSDTTAAAATPAFGTAAAGARCQCSMQ
jgi:hypothetical protein